MVGQEEEDGFGGFGRKSVSYRLQSPMGGSGSGAAGLQDSVSSFLEIQM